MKGPDRPGRDPRVPEEPAREVAVADEGRLSRGGGVGEERILGLEQPLLRPAPRVVRADEFVGGQNSAANEERREEDEVENEEGRDAEAFQAERSAISRQPSPPGAES